MTFDQCRDTFLRSHNPGWSNAKHRDQWRNTLHTYASPHFGNLPVAGIDVGLVMKALEPIWSTKPETASRVRQRMEKILDWAATRGYRERDNPARWKGHLENLLPKRGKMRRVRHHPALPLANVGTFVEALRTHEGMSARALEFLILTAARTGEVLGATWDEIDFGSGVWTIPAERMKAGREHRVPLSDCALTILRRLNAIRRGDLIFTGNRRDRPISNMSMMMQLRRMGRGDVTVHGFRSTFRDWAAERTSFPNHVVEMALAHSISSDVEAAYRRGDLFDKRRRLMDAWARYCDTPTKAGEVVPLKASTT